SALPPYLVDFYAHERLTLLPLDPSQEFRSRRVEAWGNYDYGHLLQVYENLLKMGYPVFLTQYGLGNEKYLHDAFDAVLAHFNSVKVYSGCYELCDIYQLQT